MNDRFIFNAIVSSYYDIDTPEHYEEFEPQIYLENVDLFSDEIGIDYDRLLEAVQNQLKLEKPEISQIMQHFEDNSNSSSEEYVTIKPDKVLQCTSLKDKNGKLIYEGDIVNGSCGAYWGKMIVEYNVAGFVLNKNGKYLNFLKGDNYIEVIGNKFKNPELLKE